MLDKSLVTYYNLQQVLHYCQATIFLHNRFKRRKSKSGAKKQEKSKKKEADMDLRVVKTKKVIRESFLELRKTHPLEKIKVTELCKNALINKTTFYRYYQDVYALSDELEQEIFDEFWKNLENRDTILKDPSHFIDQIPSPEKLDPNSMVYCLFHDRMEDFFQKTEKCVKEYYLQKCHTSEEKIRLIFLINGIIYTGREIKLYHNYNEGMIKETFLKIISDLKEISFLPDSMITIPNTQSTEK